MPSQDQKGGALRARLRKAFGNEYVLLLVFAVLIGLAVSYGIVAFRKLVGLFQLAAFAAETEKYFGTLVAVAFMYAIFLVQDGAAKLPMPVWLRPALGGLAIGCIALTWPQILGVGYQSMGLALKEALPLGLLFALIFAKMAATSIALGSGFAGGIFSPSLFIGAMTGGAFGLGAAQLLPEFASTHGAYTVLGMVGVASAVLGAPISTMLIIFELTNNTQMTIAVMVTVTIATVVAQQITGRRSFFVWQLERRGVTLGDTREQEMLLATTIESAVSDDFALLPKTASLKAARELFARERPAVVFVVDDEGRLEGCVTPAGFLERAHDAGEKRVTAGDVARPCETLILPNASLERATRLMAQGSADYLPVVDDIQARRALGVIFHKDLMLARKLAATDS